MNSLIKSDDSTGEVSDFQLPLVEGPVITSNGHISVSEMPTAKNLEALFEQARQEGFETGHREGLEQALETVEPSCKAIKAISEQLLGPLDQLNDEVIQAMADLSVLVAGHIVRRELENDPSEIVGVVRDAVKQLPLSEREIRIYLNPEDLKLVEETLGVGEHPRGWRLEPDLAATRGGCVIQTDVSHIDASVEGRLAATVSKMFGGERQNERS